MDFRQLRTFRCVADTGSLSRASERLRIGQPALSRQIKLLEHTIGVTLFDRHVRGMELKPAGTDLYQRISAPLYQLEQSFAEVRSSSTQISGQVTLGVLPTVTPAFAVRLLERVHKELPDVTLYLKEAYSVDLLEWIQDGTVDAGFLYGPASAYHLPAFSLLSEEIVLLSPLGTLSDTPETIHPKELTHLPLGLLSRPMGPRMVIDRMTRKHGITLHSVFDVDSFPILVAMVKAGLCHTFLPLSSITEDHHAKQFDIRRIRPDAPMRELIMAQPSQRPTTRATDAVFTLLRHTLSEMISEKEIDAIPSSDLIQPYTKKAY